MGERSLALDAGGWAHIAYGGDHLYHAWQDEASWHLETIDSGPQTGGRNALALDENGYAHIGYIAGYPNYDLKYATQDASGWHIETVDSAAKVRSRLALALDRQRVCSHQLPG